MKSVRRRKRVQLSLTAAALACISCAAAGQTHMPNEEFLELRDNSWILVSRGDVTAPPGILAYSSGWYDSDAHQFCIFGGGHFNYSGNEVWCLDIAELQWTELYPADVVALPPYSGADQGGYENYDNERYPGVLFQPEGEPIEETRPFSRHTYDLLEFVPGVGALLWGGFGWGDHESPWCTTCTDTWSFDFTSRAWNYLYDGHNPSPNTTAGAGASAYSVVDNRLYAKVFRDTWTFDLQSQRWSKLRTRGRPPWTIEGTLEYDPNHGYLYFFGGNYESNLSLWRYAIDKQAWSLLEPDGNGPQDGASSGPGVAYDTRNDVLLVYFGGTIWVYDPDADNWTTLRSDPHPPDRDYVFGRFRYDPVNNGFWLHTWDDGAHETWFYKYRN